MPPPPTNPFEDSFEATLEGNSNAVSALNINEVSLTSRGNGPSQSSGINPFEIGDDGILDRDVPLTGSVVLPSNNNSSINPFDNNDFSSPRFSHTTQPQLYDANPADDDGYNDDYTQQQLLQDGVGSGVPIEASWQYLGDLPYRRVAVYTNVRWNQSPQSTESTTNGKENQNKNNLTDGIQREMDRFNHGLATYPPTAVAIKRSHPDNVLGPGEIRELLKTTTTTKVAGCPHGGPIAAMTIPILAESGSFHQTALRIMTNSGRLLQSIEFPPRGLDRRYNLADVMTIGFTDRTILVVVLRDSLCLTYDLRGDPVLQPFHILPRGVVGGDQGGGSGKGSELLHATVFEGGVAVLSLSKQAALVELLDDHDDPAYANSAHLGARKIMPSITAMTEAFGPAGDTAVPPHYAIVTHLPTAAYASDHFLSYRSIAVLPRFHTTSRHPEVFLSTSDNSVIIVNTATTDIVDVNCRSRIASPIVDMSFAPNGRFLACFTESCMLTVISTSFETKVLDFDTSEGSSSPPLEMKWCGEDSVVLHWRNLGVLMVGPYGDWLRFPFQEVENLFLIPEIDCCRVVTDSSVEILQRVPPATALLLRIGSIEPAAMLLDASDAFDAGSPSSDEAARALTKTGMLLEAIETCTEAALKEFDIAAQKRLLRAASFGMQFAFKDPNDARNLMGGPMEGVDDDGHTMPSPTTKKFVAATRKLRILNALRRPTVGFVLSSSQYDTITPIGVIARLIAMKRPALACSICQYLGLPKSVRLYARASKAAALVALDSTHSDTETADAAIRIINEDVPKDVSKSMAASMNRGAYATVAMAASRAGRPGVANLLLMLESSVADKVPALISIGSYADAMAVATSARDADFIFFTLMEYEKYCMSNTQDVAKGQSTFLGTVVTKFTPEGFHNLRRYMETMPEVKNVMNLLTRAQKFTDAGSIMALRALKTKDDPRQRQNLLSEASRVFGLGKDTGFQKTCTDELLELFNDQEVLRTKYGSAYVAPHSTSVTDTIVSVIRFAAVNRREQHRLLVDADKIAKKFRVPEKRLWHIKVKAFSESEQWTNLRLLAESKTKPPIGYKPFARAAIKGKLGVSDIMRYIEKVAIPEEKYDLFCEAALWKRALEEAAKLKDLRRVANVKSLCNSSEIQLLADEIMGRMA